MTKYIIRLDDACPKKNHENWNKIENILDEFSIRPLVGIIPDCKDPDMDCFTSDDNFWTKTITEWQNKNWKFALHGVNHIFCTENGGINPVNSRSEFAGLSFDEQCKKIKMGIDILHSLNIEPKVFFAPAHTFDINTIKALQRETDIRVISDTPAGNVYNRYGITFVPQQSGHVRKLPFKIVTFCYHPNIMKEKDFELLRNFLAENSNRFIDFPEDTTDRKLSLFDKLLMRIYYWRHK